ncbi:ISL3 family transposase (plasmid) [Dermatophilaceae bacterium Sec6.4]
MSDPTLCCPNEDDYCDRCDLLIGLPGLRVIGVERGAGGALTVRVESPPGLMGCTTCGVVAHGHGRRPVRLVDIPSAGVPVTVIWSKRRWVCPELLCPVGSFTEQNEQVAVPRALLTERACWWAIGQLRREHASISGLARQMGTTWHTVWDSIRPLLQAAVDDETRFAGVTMLGVDEHVWHHVSERKHGPKFFTGMVDLTRDIKGHTNARLLDLVPGRSGAVYAGWLTARGEAFRDGIQVATLDPFHVYKNAIDDHLDDAIAVVDPFHIVKLATQAVDEVRRRVQQETTGHRGRRGDPLYGIQTILRCGQERLTDRQRARLDRAIAADERHEEVYLAWQASQLVRDAYKNKDLPTGRATAQRILGCFATCPIPEIKRLGTTLKRWKEAFLAYFDTNRASNGGTEAVNGLIELHRRVARGIPNRNNYRLRMLLIGGGLNL